VLSESEQSTSGKTDPELILPLQRATHGTLRLLAGRLAEENLSPSEINALANLADGQFRSVGELAIAAGVKPTTLTGVLDRLWARGYLTRELDLGDRRSFLLHLTAEGTVAAQNAAAAIRAIEQEAVAELTPADLDGFHKVLHALDEVSR
jgi:MarR family transcriptional regulator, organic hydroperoxide resistance regulator